MALVLQKSSYDKAMLDKLKELIELGYTVEDALEKLEDEGHENSQDMSMNMGM